MEEPQSCKCEDQYGVRGDGVAPCGSAADGDTTEGDGWVGTNWGASGAVKGDS